MMINDTNNNNSKTLIIRRRQALALNNEGVTLLAQGHFAAAQQRFSQSLRLLEALSQHQQPKNTVLPSDSVPSINASSHPLDIHIVEDSDLENLRFALQYGGSHSVFFAVVLRDDDPIEDPSSSPSSSSFSWTRHYSTILYNHVISHLAHLECQRFYHPLNADLVLSSGTSCAHRSLVHADDLLTNLVFQQGESLSQDASPNIQWKHAQLLLILGLIKNCLATHHVQQGNCNNNNNRVCSPRETVLQDIHHLETALDNCAEDLLLTPSVATPAA